MATQMKSIIDHSTQQNAKIQNMHKLLVQQKQAQVVQSRQIQQMLQTMNDHITECRAIAVSIRKILHSFTVIQYFFF